MCCKFQKCCCCVKLRVGCIVIGIVGLLLAIISAVDIRKLISSGIISHPQLIISTVDIRKLISSGNLSNPEIPSFVAIAVAFIGSAALIFAAVNTNGGIKKRNVAIGIYMITSILIALFCLAKMILISIIIVPLISVAVAIGIVPIEIHILMALPVAGYLIDIFLQIYFSVVAYSFYKELNGQNSIAQAPA